MGSWQVRVNKDLELFSEKYQKQIRSHATLILLVVLVLAWCAPVSASVSANLVGTPTVGTAPLLPPDLKHVIPVNAKTAYVSDLDNDGTNELLVGTYQSAGKESIILYKFLSGNYQPLWNFNIADTGWGAVTAITTGDTDNDGIKEIIVSTGLCHDSGCGAIDRSLRIFKRSSEDLNSWSLDYSYKINELTDPLSLAVGDADNDGKNELIVGMSWFSRSILQFKNSGSSYQVSTIESTGSDVNSINIIDIDHDGLNEIVAGTSCWSKYNVGILKKVGSTWTRTWNSPKYGWSQAVSGDIDHDGLNEILATQATGSCGSQGNSGFARIYKNNTEIWNYDSTRAYYIDGGRPAMGDLNRDGVPEFAFITRNTTHQILNIFTSNNPTFTPEYKYAITFPWISNPNWMTWSYEVIGDSDNNGINEIIMAGLYDGTLKIYELEPVATPPIANFAGIPIFGTRPLTVTFTDSSTNTPTSWNWNFGDGSSSLSQDPAHTFTSVGTYTVALTATNLGGSNTVTRTDYITVINLNPVAEAGTPQTVIVKEPVTFDGSQSKDPDGSIASYTWDFGDGVSSFVVSPTHSFETSGTFTINLTVTDNDGATGTDSTTVTVKTPAKASQDVITQITSMSLEKGTANALTSKLDNAIKSLDKGNVDAAKNQINATINEINAQKGKKISDGQAYTLISALQKIIKYL